MTFHQVFPWQDLVAPLTTATLLPLLLTAVTRHRPAWQSLAGSAAAWICLLGPVVFHRIPAPAILTGTARGLRDGWHTILNTVLPVPHRPELVVVAFTATWAAATATAELAARTRAPAAPAIPPLCVLVLANLLGAGGPDSSARLLLVATVTAALTIASMGQRARPTTSRGTGRNPGPGTGSRPPEPMAAVAGRLLTVAAVSATALAVGPHMPLISHAVPFDPKSEVRQPPPALQRAVSPLDEANSWLAQPDRELFTVRASTGVPWRLAVFDHFDGAQWTDTGRWEPTGGRVPPAPTQNSGTRTDSGPALDQTVVIAGLTGPWLPTAERPTDISGLDVAVDPASGIVAADAPLRPGQTYTVRSVPAHAAPDRLASAAVAQDAEARAALQLPATDSTGQTPAAYQDLLTLAGTATQGATTPYQQASMLERYLRTEERYDPSVPAGYSYHSLQEFVDTTHRGSTVQSAAAFVVMARSLGLPSRIAVGFGPGTERDGVWHVTTGDVMAWPEVDFDGLGWVAFRSTLDEASTAGPSPALPDGPGRDPTKSGQGTTPQSPSTTGSAPDPDDSAGDGGNAGPVSTALPSGNTWWPLAATAAAGVFVLYLATVPTAPWRRRRRRARVKDPAERIRLAWRQAIEQLPDRRMARLEQGRKSPLTTVELARSAGTSLGHAAEPHLIALAALVDAAGYAASGPDPAAADAAWRHCAAVEDLARRRPGGRRRLARRIVGRT